MNETDAVVVLIVTPTDKAESIGRAIVGERLAACVNVIPQVKSFYWWEGELQNDEESVLIVKTLSSLVEKMTDFVRTVHPYENFELIAQRIESGSQSYLGWIRDSVAQRLDGSH